MSINKYTENVIVQKDNHYVDNDKFHQALVAYKDACAEAKANGVDDPKIPEYIGKCFLDIATNLAKRYNFNRYSYKDEMISDGYLNCLLYFRNYDPAWAAANGKKPNPHAYFTLYCSRAFVRRLLREEKASYTKYKYILSVAPLEQDLAEDSEVVAAVDTYDNIKDFVSKFEAKMAAKKAKTKEKRKAAVDALNALNDDQIEEEIEELGHIDVLLESDEGTEYNDEPDKDTSH